MKRHVLLFLLGLIVTAGQAQQTGHVSKSIQALRDQKVSFEPRALFTAVERSAATEARWSQECAEATPLRIDHSATAAVLAERPARIALELPSAEGPMVLDLALVDITAAGFNVVQASTGAAADYTPGLHYQGMVRGVPGSIAAISVFPDEVMGLVSDAEGDKVLGRLADGTDGMHVFYRESDLLIPHTATCGTSDAGEPYDPSVVLMEGQPKTTKCVRFYWEVNYDIFQNKGSVTNAANYVTGLFNQSAILYANDGISVVLSQVYVWDIASPYTFSDTGDQLDQFGETRTSFNGDLAHLLGFTGGGGIAWLNTLCSNSTFLRMAYSDINSTFSNVPTYSWSVEVVTHEQGHNMGSRHTHACAWNGNNTAIDGCGPAAGYTEGSCAAGPVPSSTVGGTIMSYCHLTSAGIKFSNGFGPQPTAVIVNAIANGNCLQNCAVSCGNPSALTATSITNTSAVLGWAAVSGATSYSLQWKLASSGTWTTVTGISTNSHTLGGLAAANSYQFQVLAVCPSGSSVYSSVFTFSTTGGCQDSNEPNNTTAAPAIVTLPLNVNALIASGTDVDYYRFTLAATSNVTISLSNLAGDYDLRLLNSGGTQVAISENGSTTSESISYPNAGAGNYFIHVYGFNGAFSATQCYALTASAAAVQTCGVPSGLASGSVTSSAATLSWAAVGGAVSYNLQWKPASSGTWTTVTGITGTSHVLSGLAASTAYNFQVMSVCNGSSSAYSTAANFTTGAAACVDTYEPNGTQATATPLVPNVTLNALINVGTDIDWYTFANSSTRRNIRVRLTNLPANYTLTLFRSGTQVANSANTGTTSETIILNNATISSIYRVRVRTVNTSTFNATQCYTLTVETSPTPFSMPEGSPEFEEGPTSEAMEFGLFPNPASDVVTVQLPPHAERATIEVMDALGHLVHSEQQGPAEGESLVELSVADRTEGLYLVRVTLDGSTVVQRLVITR